MASEVIIINGDANSTSQGVSPIPPVNITGQLGSAGNDLSMDAWGRQKVVNDYSLFHGIWTYAVSDRVWEEHSVAGADVFTPLVQTGTLCKSIENMLEVQSGTTANEGSALLSKRHPRYQPNRGHLYSTACILPNADADGIRRWGLFKNGNGVYFELEGDGADYTLYAVRKSDGVIKTREECTLPTGFDPEKGHVYDIQYQWRGLGNYKFFIDLQEAYYDNILGTLTELSLRMPALPAAFQSVTHTTTSIKIQCGCVDITSEGGQSDGRQFATVSTGTTLLKANTTGSAMIAVKIPRDLIYNGDSVLNTRDLIASKLTSWTRDEAALQVYFARDVVATNLDGLTWLGLPDSTANYLIGGNGSALDVAFQLDRGNMQLVLNEWDDIEKKNVVINPDPDSAPFYLTAGDIMVCCVQGFAGVDDNATTLYLSEEI